MRFSALLLAAGLLCTLPACADDIFTINSGSNTVTFTLPGSMAPTLSNSMAFQLAGVTVDVNGANLTDQAVDFYTAADGGGLEIMGFSPFTLNLEGDQLFDGSTSDPVFSSGNFSLRSMYGNFYTGDPEVGISAVGAGDPVGAAPEPSSFVLLGTGLLVLAATFLQRRRRSA